MTLAPLSRHVGGHNFAKVEVAFSCLGFHSPRADTPDTGAYVSNIAGQYRADLTEHEVRAIVAWALDKPLAYFVGIRDGEYTVAEIAVQYGD